MNTQAVSVQVSNFGLTLFKISLILFTVDVLWLLLFVRGAEGYSRTSVLWAIRAGVVCFWLIFLGVSLIAIRFIGVYAAIFLAVPALLYYLYRSDSRESGDLRPSG